MSYRKAVLFLIIITGIVRCLIGANLELGIDEVYYWNYSQYLQWNYFDHPPMVGILIRLTTLNLSLQQFELFVRLGSIICCASATWLLYKTVSRLGTERAGFIAAIFYNASFYGSIITGLFILPDSPQMLFWTASLFILSMITRAERPITFQWLVFGALTGLTIMSKIHGVFIWSGLFLYVIFLRRQWLRAWQLYVSAAITFIISSPILLWNIQNNFITYRYHSSRLTGIHLRMDSFLREVSGEIFYNNPVIVVCTFAALLWFFRKPKKPDSDFLKLSLLIALPMILLLLSFSLFNDTLPHWTGPAYITLIPLAAIYVSQTKPGFAVPRVVKYALAFTSLVVIIGVWAVRFYPGTSGKHDTPSKFGQGDVTLDMYGWKIAAAKIDSLVVADQKNGIIGTDAEFVFTKMFSAAHIDYYIARPLDKFVVGLGEMIDLHHYEWLNEYRLKNHILKDAYCVFPSNYDAPDVHGFLASNFETVDSVGAFPVYRGGKVCKYFFIYRMKNFKGVVPKVKQKN